MNLYSVDAGMPAQNSAGPALEEMTPDQLAARLAPAEAIAQLSARAPGEGEGAVPRELNRLIRAYFQHEKYREALECIAVGEEAGLEDPGILQLKARVLWRLGRVEELETLLSGFLGTVLAENLEVHTSLCRVRLQLGKFGEARASYDRAVLLAPDDPDVLETGLQLAVATGDRKVLVAALGRALARGDDVARKILRKSAPMLQIQPDPEVMELLRRSAEIWPKDPLAMIYQRLSGETRRRRPIKAGGPFPKRLTELQARVEAEGGTLPRAPVDDDGTLDVIVSETAGTGATALVLTGMDDGLNIRCQDFDCYLASLGYSAVYLRDFDRNLFLNGVGSLGRSLDETEAALRPILETLGTTRLVVIGSSTGGLAAIRLGTRLGAAEIRIFSGVLDISAERRSEIGDQRARVLTFRIADQVGDLPPEMMSARAQVMASGYGGQIRLVYGRDMAVDRSHARTLEGLPNVEFVELDTSGHGSIRYLVAEERLFEALPPRAG